MRLEWKFLAPKISVAESDVDDEFAEVAAITIAGIVAKRTLKRNKSWSFQSRALRLRAMGYHLSYGIIQSSCHPTQVNVPRLKPSQTGRYPIYLPRRDGRLSWPRWLVTYRYIPRWFTVLKISFANKRHHNVKVTSGDKVGFLETQVACPNPHLRNATACFLRHSVY